MTTTEETKKERIEDGKVLKKEGGDVIWKVVFMQRQGKQEKSWGGHIYDFE